MLPAYAGTRDLPLALRRHLSGCPGCRVELARYEALSGSLSGMTAHAVEAPPGLKAALLAIPSQANRLEHVRSHVARNRTKYAGAAAALVGMAGAALWQSRRRTATA